MASKRLLPGYLNGLQPKEARERYIASCGDYRRAKARTKRQQIALLLLGARIETNTQKHGRPGPRTSRDNTSTADRYWRNFSFL